LTTDLHKTIGLERQWGHCEVVGIIYE
jgi:hypothetical protein